MSLYLCASSTCQLTSCSGVNTAPIPIDNTCASIGGGSNLYIKAVSGASANTASLTLYDGPACNGEIKGTANNVPLAGNPSTGCVATTGYYSNFYVFASSNPKAQEYATTTSYSDPNCTTNAQVAGFLSITGSPYTCASSPAVTSSTCQISGGNGGAPVSYSKTTACTTGVPAPASGVWYSQFADTSCSTSSLLSMYPVVSGSCGPSPFGSGGSSRPVCTTGGGAQMWSFSSADCSGDVGNFYDLGRAYLNNSFCSPSSSSGSFKYACFGAEVAPWSYASKTCAGSSLPTSAASTGISCFTGQSNASSLTGSVSSTNFTTSMYGVQVGFKVCVAATGKLNGHTVRNYLGASSIDDANTLVAGLYNIADVTMCTSNNCNSPTKDACTTYNGVLPALTPLPSALLPLRPPTLSALTTSTPLPPPCRAPRSAIFAPPSRTSAKPPPTRSPTAPG